MVCLMGSNPEIREQILNLADKLGTEYDIAKIILLENNGYDLDKAPNGAESKLYKDLLEAFNGDEQLALIAKAKTYLQPFFNWFGEWTKNTVLKDDNLSIDYLFSINPELEKIGTKLEYAQYISTIFPDSKVTEVYWHGTDSDFSEGIENAKRGKGSGAPETKDEMYFNKLPWASLLYISGINRNTADKNGFSNWVKLWWELKEILGNGRMLNDDWKNIIIGPDIRLEIPNKKGVFNRNKGGNNGKYLSERKSDYGYENKSDKLFFEEVFGIKYGLDTFLDWVDRNANIFKQIWKDRKVVKGMYPAVLNVQNPIIEEGLNTYYEEQRGLFTIAKLNNNDAIISNKAKNEFGSDVAIILDPKENVHILGTKLDLLQFAEWKRNNGVSKVVDENGEPFVAYTGTKGDFTVFDSKYSKTASKGFFFTADKEVAKSYGDVKEVFLNIKNLKEENAELSSLDLENGKYDGISYIHDGAEAFVVWNPNQIKSATDNIGSYSTDNPDIYYKQGETISSEEAKGRLETVGEFTNTLLLVDYILTLDNVDPELKKLLQVLKQESTRLVIEEFQPGKAVAAYAGYVKLYAPVVSSASNQEFAEDVAHELMHHYLQQYYNTHPEFRSKLDLLLAKYRKTTTDSDQYGFTGSSVEFLNEFMVNRSFRYGLKRDNVSFFEELLQIITQAIKKLFTGAKPRRLFNSELKSLENTIYDLLSKVNKGDIEHYTEDTYKHVVFRQSTSRPSTVSNRSKKLYDKIRKGLENRLKAIKHYSSKNIKAENQLLTLILDLSNLDAIEGTLEFIDHVSLSILDCIRFLNTPYSNINYKQIRQLSDDYIGFYKPLIDEVFSAFVNTDDFKNIPDYNQILESVRTILSDMSMIDIKFNELLKNKGKLLLIDHLNSTNTPQEFIDRILNWLDDPTNDGNFLTTWLGMSSESTNEVITTIANILSSVMNETLRKTYLKGIELVKILDKAKKKYGNDVLKILYELDNNGKYTGFMVRKLNYGQMRQDYIDYTEKLAKKLGILKDNEGKFIMPEDLTVLDKWLTGINKFYSEHAERRFTPQYYELRNRMLSHETRQALDEINTAINEILDYVYEDGVYYENLLTPQMFNKLQLLRRNKKLLSIEYNLDGTMKTGLLLLIAREIQAFNRAIYGDNPESKVNYKKFKEDEAKVIARYGKDSNEHKYWLARNTTTRLTLDFYDRLDNLQSNRNQLSLTYKELVDKRSQLLKIYRLNGIVNIDELSESDKQMLLQLDQDIADAYVVLDSQYDENQDKFNDFATINTTELYDRDYRAASVNQATFDQWFKDNHYEDAKGNMRPASYYTYLWAKEARYVETVPTGRYSQLEALPLYTNNNFDINGPAILPKKSLYDNSKLYNKIMQSKELRDLYNAILDTMREANKLISYFTSTDTYKMPQIEARMLLVLSRSNGLFDAIGYAFNDVITTKSDDIDYVDEFLVKPNGLPLKLIPTRYIKMLSNTNNISTDAIGSVILYYSMALNYSGMSEQLDKIEILLKLLYESTMTTKKGYKGKGSMNYYQQALALVDRIMYGRKVDPIKVNIGGKEINISKALNNIRNWVSKVNLSFNFNTIGVSFLTDATYTTLEAKLGRFFNSKDFSYAKKRFLQELPEMLANTGNPVPTTVVGYLMQLNQVVRDNQEIFSRLDQSAALRAMNQHFWYLGYTQSDYTVKSHSLISIYHSYKLIKNNGFMSRDLFINKFYPNNRKKGEVEFDHLNSITLIDAYEKYKDGFRVKPLYQEFVTQSLLDLVKNRIEIVTKRIDGTLRDIDKAKIHANSVTAYLTQHRNFMINGLHLRFKGRTYNQDMQVIEDGYYPTTYRFLSNIIGNKHYAVKLILEDYNNLDESEQYAIRRVLYDLALVASTTIVALTVMHIVDSDDDYSNWFTEEIAYLALRSAFEFRSMYNPVELMSLIKSPTAAFSYFENLYNILGILNPLNYIYGKTPWTAIDRGVYEGWPRILKTMIKTTPFKNILEIQDPKAKRNYLKNLLMSF